MSINLKMPETINELKPRITVFGVGGAGGNAVNNMIQAGLEGVEFVVANTDAQALAMSSADSRIQMGTAITEGLGAGSQPHIGAAAAEESMAEILDHVTGAHMVFITAGMGGGTGTGAAPVIARLAREQQILTIGVVTKPFQFEGERRLVIAEEGIAEFAKHVDTLIVIPNQNLFRVANERTTFADAFAMADQVLYSGVAGITDLMVKEGLINLDFADVRTIMTGMGKAMMGTGEACGEKRAIEAAEAAIANPLLDDVSMRGAAGLLISITGGEDLTLYEVDEAATRIRQEVDEGANIILGATFDNALEGYIRVSVVATGIEGEQIALPQSSTLSQQTMSSVSSDEALIDAGAQQQPAALGRYSNAPSGALGSPPAKPVDVTVRRVDPHQSIGSYPASSVDESQVIRENEHVDSGQPFIPPNPSVVGRRMPSVEDFPIHVQREMAARGKAPAHHGVEAQKRKTGFLERLANVGLGRRSDAVEAGINPDLGFSVPQPSVSQPQRDQGDIERGQLDDFTQNSRVQHGEPQERHQVASAVDEDDELEIPAFLRRQAN